MRQGVFVEGDIAERLSCGTDEVARIRDVLQQLRLLAPCQEGPPVPVSPDLAEAELSALLESGILERRQQLARIHRQMRSLAPLYREHQQPIPTSRAVRLIENPAEVRRELAAAARNCSREAFTVQPGGGRNARTLNEAVVRDTAMLERGVKMRILYQHTARANLATRTYVRKVSALGAEVRTAEEVYERLIIFDRSVAFVPQERQGSQPPGAAIVTDETTVGYLWRIHDKMWDSARPYDASDVEYASTSEEIKSSILRLMATGLKDDVIARKLGMATRTCRRYMAGIMDELGATSRFQAGALAAAQGLVTPDPQDSTGGAQSSD
ncbi:LuxR C-terminal-related transcriptional regulator [Streptomyces sp. TRM70350]|uniref:LuxR C-terminal-related transcriptional regulator n=1 Tax=Streptomyces sp. TRM70350 TaxID=2856165 RepID=UPI001C479316|nr:LuxR C-terminal-related transcriptional regulator [Streptomyces sp. TRM70350]MBV7696602.1 LuxR C-terminal-related transcriptional regulator [Streptomyces sp. TRM70350]